MSGALPAVEIVMTRRTWGMLVALSVLWGCSFPFIKVALGGVPPLTLVFARVVIAALALTPVVLLTRTSLPRSCALWAFFLSWLS